MSALVIVESPAKSKTIKKYLGPGFEVLASYGHVRDLLPKAGAVDPEQDFAMTYQAIERNAKHMDAIAKKIKKADTLYLATDPDREGEAIAWHVVELLKEQGLLQGKTIHRVAFHQITKKAVQDAIAKPKALAMDLVDAQQARRGLDFLVGFNLSPLLWRKVRAGLSAGRVQSPALRLIVERELEIEAFESQEYWTITADHVFDKQAFDSRLTVLDETKVEQFSLTTEAQANTAKETLQKAADGHFVVEKVEKKQRKRQPPAPFITSTLQQEAARKLGFTAQRTMRIAQQLYEGVDVGQGAEGLITYMRTDSVTLAQEALDEIRAYLLENFGEKALPDTVRVFKTKAKNAQEAHEAIRPTSAYRNPEEIKTALSPEQFKLYQLIWKRTLACQMIHATIATVAVDLTCGKPHRFRANGSRVVDPGFMALYLEGMDDQKDDASDEKWLPNLAKGDVVDVRAIDCHQHFTEPPPRYSEASLIKALEEFGIGRPSTYASIIATLQNREYVTLEKKRFYPTDVARVVNKFLTQYFARYVDYDFTAKLEDELDEISRGEKEWVPVLRAFWGEFKQQIDTINETVSRSDVTQEEIDEKCPECDKSLAIRLGKRGRFIGCTAYPECKYTRNLGDDEASTPEVVAGRSCPKCEADLLVKSGRYGKFIGCSAYPECKHIEPLEKPISTEISCPTCKKAMMMKRKSRRGKVFYSCERYPDCKYATWDLPIEKPCPKCQWPIVTLKVTKSRGEEYMCPQKECDYRVPTEGEDVL